MFYLPKNLLIDLSFDKLKIQKSYDQFLKVYLREILSNANNQKLC